MIGAGKDENSAHPLQALKPSSTFQWHLVQTICASTAAMSGYIRPAEARASHLANISNFYAPAQPQASSYWGSELNDLEAALDLSFKPGFQRDYCHACGQIQISGVSSTTKHNTVQHVAPGADAIRKRRKIGAGFDEAVSLTRCLHCNRYTKAPSKPAKLAKDSNPKEAKKAAGHITSDQAAQPSPMPTDGSEKKAKRKQKKGGLAAILARSKESASSRPAQQMLDFADLARKS